MIKIFQDTRFNNGNIKAQVVLILFRMAQAGSGLNKPFRYLAYPYGIFYRFFVEWILGIELPWKLKAGPGLRIYHGQALVVNDRAVLGAGCILRNSTTIGVANTSVDFGGAAPVIGDNVDIGANVVILGGITIGSNSVIGAGSVVIRDVPPYSVVVGNPARVIRMLHTGLGNSEEGVPHG